MSWVVKLGGSLNDDPLLPHWLNLLAQLGGGRVVLVCGGGRFADAVREHQALWKYNDLAAHNMALLAMAQTAQFLRALNPAFQLVSSEEDIARTLRLGKTALWQPLELLREQPDEGTNWSVTSDSIALALAQRLGAQHLVIVKSCTVDPSMSLAQLGAAGIVDEGLAALAAQAAVAVQFLRNDELDRMRGLLLGDDESGPSGAASDGHGT
jgi:aspartokinase-like uncharacterized kinase